MIDMIWCVYNPQILFVNFRQKLVDVISSHSSHQVLISHGTDSLLDTATYLASKQQLSDKLIILTGARKPETFKDSDADFNVGVAVGALQCIPGAGVFVAMNGQVIKSDIVARNMNTGEFYTNK